MKNRDIVCGHHRPEKQERARQLRREMTPAENRLWHKLRRSQLGGLHFRRQQVIDGFIADFYCHVAGLIVEVDGGIHHNQSEYDEERDRILASRGLRILRVSNERVFRDSDVVLEEILAAASERP